MGLISLTARVKALEEENKALKTQITALQAYIPLLTALSQAFPRDHGVVTGLQLPQGDDKYLCELDEKSGDIVWAFTPIVM